MLKFFKHLFFREEAQEYVEMGALNALFVLGRSMGFIGEFFSFQVFDLVISRKMAIIQTYKMLRMEKSS